MPLPVLVAMVVVGVSLVVLLVHLTGGSRLAEIANAEQATARFLIDYPEAAVERGIVSADRRDAVLELGDGHVGLVHVVGSNFLTRFVSRGEMAARASGQGAVDLLTHDLTWPRAHMTFSDDETARDVAGLFASELGPRAQQRAA